ncbi:homoserine kinase [Nocardioides sp.]|uniref:homoserine kinase n=1 Tax=Nocardioides sp. TaxID=35761 RepID=UPI002732BF82|nr:homoserine kinase [Nocardioides sp.]MDP3891182.1 homoserine kinase [Nocardioides sp.]
MARFVDGPVRVRVPASSANLGPGFDALGLALDLHDELEAEVLAEGLEIEVSGAGSGDVPRDESHLVVRSMRQAFAVLGAEPPGLRLRCDNVIPHSRGLGSSSAAIVAGLTLARALVRGGTLVLDDDALFRLAADIEGHPDNVAPVVHGGFVISGEEGGTWFAARSAVDPRVSAVVFVPPDPVSTDVARGLLPGQVPHARAAANGGRAALLVAALAGQPELLHTATRDFIHQDYREPAMPESLALVRALRADGWAAVVSGAGPTVLAFTDSSTAEELAGRCPTGWLTRHLAIDRVGCHTL